MKPLFDTPSGDATERRFFRAARKRTKETPHWYRGVRQASVMYDVRGLDALASIKRPDDPKPMSVPLQVKSSSSGRRRYYQEHPEAKRLGVPVIVITDDTTDAKIRDALFAALEPFLTMPRGHFATYLGGLGKGGLSKRGVAIKKHISQRRKLRP